MSQVPCRNAFATTQTRLGGSMTDPPALQVALSVRLCVGESLHVSCKTTTQKKDFGAEAKSLDPLAQHSSSVLRY